MGSCGDVCGGGHGTCGGMRLLCGVMLVMLAMACTEETKVDVAKSLYADRIPTMCTRNISTLISDSGVTQYRIVAPLWEVYDEGENPHWRFPEGIYLRKYDPKFRVIATIAADSAIYHKDRQLWELDGHVEITKEPRELFLSQQVFWNQNTRKVYSDSFIHIENATHVLEGHGFESNENFTSYTITRPTGIFPAVKPDAGPANGTPAAAPGPEATELSAKPSESPTEKLR